MPYTELTLPKAILFDWDNTLVDTMPLIISSINHALVHFNMDPWTPEDVKKKTQLSARDSLPLMFGERWKEALGIYRDFYHQNHINQLKPFDDALSLLDCLAECGVQIALVSNKVGETLRNEVLHLGWEGRFGAMIGSGDADRDKPHAEPALLALSQLGVQPSSDVWFVGDATVDWECAKNSGCLPVPIGFAHAEAYHYPYAVENCGDLKKNIKKVRNAPWQ